MDFTVVASTISSISLAHCTELCWLLKFSLPMPVATDQVEVRVVLSIAAVILLMAAVWSLKRQF
jgi:hypothetical protein